MKIVFTEEEVLEAGIQHLKSQYGAHQMVHKVEKYSKQYLTLSEPEPVQTPEEKLKSTQEQLDKTLALVKELQEKQAI